MFLYIYIPFSWLSSNFQSVGIFSFNFEHLNFFFFECFLLFAIIWFFFFLLINKTKTKNYNNLIYFIVLYFIFLILNFKNTSIIYVLNKSFILENFTNSFKIFLILFLLLFFFFIKNQIKNSFSFIKENEFLNYFLLIFFF